MRSDEVPAESLALYAGVPVTGLVLLLILVFVVVLLRRQINSTDVGVLIYANLCSLPTEFIACFVGLWPENRM